MKKNLIGLVLMIVFAITPVFALIIALLLLVLAALLVYNLSKVVKGVIAQATSNQSHRSLLYQLYRVGKKPFIIYSSDETDNWGMDDHSKCSPLVCEERWEELHMHLISACQEVGLPMWRARWVA